MTRKIKNLGLAFVAVAAMSMAAASAAQAMELHATHNADVVVTAQQGQGAGAQLKLQITHENGGPSTTCTTATFEGTHPWVSGSQITTKDVTLTATVSQCQSVGLAATVRLNGCKHTITGTTTGGVTSQNPAKTAYLDITGCTAGKKIEVIAGGGACTITIGEQHNLQHIVFSNTQQGAEPHHTHANITLTGVTYETHGALCGHTATVPRSDAQLTGQATIRSYKKTGQHQVTEHNHQFEKQTHANQQVGVLAT